MNRNELTRGERRIADVARLARSETPQAFDLAQSVLRRLRRERAASHSERSIWVMSAGAVAAAAVVLFISLPYLDVALDPLALFLEEAASSVI